MNYVANELHFVLDGGKSGQDPLSATSWSFQDGRANKTRQAEHYFQQGFEVEGAGPPGNIFSCGSKVDGNIGHRIIFVNRRRSHLQVQ